MELRRVAPAVGLGALLLVDAALIAWAFHPTAAEVSAASGGSGTSGAPTPSASSTSPTPGSASPSASPSASAVRAEPLARVVAATGTDVAWVAQAGSCSAPGVVWVTTDGGDSWSRKKAPARVLRVRPDSGSAAFVTGGDSKCSLRLWSTRDGGASWGDPQSADKAWSREPDDDRSVHRPSGSTTRPCAAQARVVDLAAIDPQTALVLCDTGRVRSTSDGGKGWADAFEVTGALALGLAPDGSAGVVVRTDRGCAGVVATAVRNGSPAGSGECVRSTPRGGEVAVASSGSRWWLVAGDEVFTADKAEGPWARTGARLGGG